MEEKRYIMELKVTSTFLKELEELKRKESESVIKVIERALSLYKLCRVEEEKGWKTVLKKRSLKREVTIP